jgi:hypothetical protein
MEWQVVQLSAVMRHSITIFCVSLVSWGGITHCIASLHLLIAVHVVTHNFLMTGLAEQSVFIKVASNLSSMIF